MERHIQPISTIIAVNDTEYLPIGGSGDYTDSGDDSGGGLAKPNTTFENDSLNIKRKDIWD